MGWDAEKSIDYYYGEYKNGFFGKKSSIKLDIYPSQLEGTGFELYENELGKEVYSFEIAYCDVSKIYVGEIEKQKALFIEYNNRSVVSNRKSTVVLLGMENPQKWSDLIEKTRKKFISEQEKKRQLDLQRREEEHRLEIEIEQRALNFYQDCYLFHIKDDTPTYQLFSDKYKIVLVYIDERKALNFLKIDGYAQEEYNGVITYEDLHYYEKAGNVSYVTDIHGAYSSFGGSMTGGKFSKLATVGGGLLFGFMGMALGAALTYKPAEHTPTNTSFSIDSDVKKVDDRSVILNFYSEIKKQYIDIELPQDIYNFLQTYLPEKKYGIVDELEKKTVIHRSNDLIQNGSLLKATVKPDIPSIEESEIVQANPMDDFKQKVEKLKIMRDAGLLSDEKFEEEQNKLLGMI